MSYATINDAGYNPANWIAVTGPAASSPEPAPTTFSPDSYFSGSTEDFFRAISAAPGPPYQPGISSPMTPLWSSGGDFETMTIDGTITGSEMALGAPKVDESLQANMSRAMLLPDGSHDWGKWIIVAGVLVTLYLIGREMGRKGPVR